MIEKLLWLVNRVLIAFIILMDMYFISVFPETYFGIFMLTLLCMVAIQGVIAAERQDSSRMFIKMVKDLGDTDDSES